MHPIAERLSLMFQKLRTFLGMVFRYGLLFPITVVLAILFFTAFVYGLIQLGWAGMHYFGWLPVPSQDWQFDLAIGLFLGAVGVPFMAFAAFNIIGKEELLSRIFLELFSKKEDAAPFFGARIGHKRIFISTAVHGQGIVPVFIFLGLPCLLATGFAVQLIVSGKDAVGGVIHLLIWGSSAFFILTYRNRIVIDARNRTVYEESGIPVWKRRSKTRPWNGEVFLRLSRIKPYMQMREGRFSWALISRGRTMRPNDGRYFYYFVEFCDESQCLRLGQFGTAAAAEKFITRVAGTLDLAWKDERAVVREG